MANHASLERLQRTAPCKRCYEAGRPRKTDVWISYNEEKFEFRIKLHAGVKNIQRGWTPHLIKIGKIFARDSYVVNRLCLMHGCGTNINIEERGDLVCYRPEILHDKSISEVFTGARLDNLRQYSETGFELEDLPFDMWNIEEILLKNMNSKDHRKHG